MNVTLDELTSVLSRKGFLHDGGKGSHQVWRHPDGHKVTLSCHGQTFTEVAANIEVAMELWLASAETHSDVIPDPDPVRARLYEIGPLLNVSELARRSGIKRSTLATKLKRETRFTHEEGSAIRRVLESV